MNNFTTNCALIIGSPKNGSEWGPVILPVFKTGGRHP